MKMQRNFPKCSRVDLMMDDEGEEKKGHDEDKDDVNYEGNEVDCGVDAVL